VARPFPEADWRNEIEAFSGYISLEASQPAISCADRIYLVASTHHLSIFRMPELSLAPTAAFFETTFASNKPADYIQPATSHHHSANR